VQVISIYDNMLTSKKRNADALNQASNNKQFKISSESDAKVETDEEEKDLESFLFGGFSRQEFAGDGGVAVKENYDEDSEEDNEEETELLSFQISTKPSIDFRVDNDQSNDDSVVPIQLGSKIEKKKPAWTDLDDDEVSIDIKNKSSLRKLRVEEDEKDVSGTTFQERLKTNFEKVLPAPAWADLNNAEVESDNDEDDEDKIFKTRKKLISTPDQLMKGILSIKKLKDLNKVKPSSSTITSLKFHPSAKIALTASLNKNLNIYQVDGRENEKLQSIFLNNFPIHCAEFTPHGDKVICSSRRKQFYVYDLVGGSVVKVPGIRGRDEKSLEKFTISPDGEIIAFIGDSGYINLVSTKTCHWISSLKMNGKVNTSAFSPDSSKLYTAGRDGEVYIWDVNSRRCLHRFIDDGSLMTTSVSISQNGQYVALGSSSGVVNVYDDKCFVQKCPSPLKTIMNLTTCIAGTCFNPTSEILACYSAQVRNALKLVHFPSLTTFSNWPIEKQTLGNIRCVDFSPKSGYLGIGNEAGKALLFRLDHFPDS